MERGERLNLVTATASELANMLWTDLELALDTFGIPSHSGSWDSDYDYAVARLRQGNDDDLAMLHAHLTGAAAAPAAEPAYQPTGAREDDVGEPWKAGMFRLFLSHVSARKDAVGELREGLRPYNVDAFVAHEDIIPTREWRQVIRKGLGTCDACAAVLSHGWRESEWCDQEIGFCVGRGVLVVPLKETHDPYGFIGDYQAFSLGRYDELPELCEALHRLLRDHELTREAMAAAAVYAFERSSSFDEARRGVEQLLEMPVEAWTPELLERARDSHEHNGQIQGAWYRQGLVSGATASLAARVGVARGFHL